MPFARHVLAVLATALSAAIADAQKQPILRVFLLAGQSNMEGHGVVDLDDARDYNGGKGTLARFLADPAIAAQWPELRRPDGGWHVRDNVFVRYATEHGTVKAGPLSVGFGVYDGPHHIGPELGLGRQLGRRWQNPVLLVKTAWGGKSLAVDFRSPGAGGAVGPFYTRMLADYRAALAALPREFPQLAADCDPDLQGVVWFQGWNDGCDAAAAAAYRENLVQLILDVRAEFGDDTLPFVVGETGNMDNATLRAGQRDGCADPRVGPYVRFVPTRDFLRRPEDSPNTGHGHHWFGNGESYLRIGDALGAAMGELVDQRFAWGAARQRAEQGKQARGRATERAGR
ncbi:MAG: sialate O-acetylesterase [Planctomycetes bacterium]|nr:sialate O-acetylesterase [Planctomycetota bacterium]